MNKKLLTLAVGAALAAGMSVAQAEVAVYGKAHVSIDMIDNDAGSEQTFVSDNSSRFGVRASEDIGGGLKALAQWEIGARTDIASPLSTNRNSFLGLGSDAFGTIRVGKYDTPYKDIGRKTDLFNERVGDTRNVIGLGSADGAFDARPSNMVRYDSPSFSGLQVALLHKSGAEETSQNGAGAATTPVDTGARYNSASVSYQGGPLFAAFGYETHDAAGSDDETGMRLGVGFKSGALTVNALYETIEDVGGVAGADGDVYGVGAAFKFGNATAKAQYFISEPDVAGADSNLMAVGLDYAFSKTVTAYVAYAQVDNDPGADNNVASANGGHGDTLAVAAGTTPSAFSVGMEMNF
jgi:predicted porin